MGLPSGIEGTRRTLQLMHALTLQGKVSPKVRNLAVSVVSRLNSRDYVGESVAMQDFVKKNIRYVQDVTNTETLQTADYTLQKGAGDCDDQSILLASLLESIGQPTRFAAVAFSDEDYSHVYVEVQPGGKGVWYGAETIVDKPFGWTPPDVSAILYLTN